MLNALHLLNRYLGISETFIWNHLNSLTKFKPYVLAAAYENLDQFPLVRGVCFTAMPAKRPLADIWARLTGTYAKVNYSPCMPEVMGVPFHILHAHYGYRAIVSLNLVAELKRPLVTTFYGYDLSQHDFIRRARSGYRELFKNGAAFFVEGPCMREKLCRMGCQLDKIHIQRIALDPEQISFSVRSWDGNSPVRFLFIGRLVEKKGLMTALEAFAGLSEKFDWRFTVVGEGPGESRAREFIQKKRLSERVILLGNIRPSDLKHYYNSHHILLQPSVTASDGDSEGGAPTVLLEAQASGMPVLSTRHDDIPNVVIEGKNALLSEERDASGLRDNMIRMVERHGDWPAMSTAGRRHIELNHNVAGEIPEMENRYLALL